MYAYVQHACRTGRRTAEKKYAYVCHVAQVETTLQHCLADVCGVERVCVCVWGGGGG